MKKKTASCCQRLQETGKVTSIASEKAHLVFIEDLLKSIPEIISHLSDRGDGASTGGGGVDGPVTIYHNPGSDAAVHSCQVGCDEPVNTANNPSGWLCTGPWL